MVSKKHCPNSPFNFGPRTVNSSKHHSHRKSHSNQPTGSSMSSEKPYPGLHVSSYGGPPAHGSGSGSGQPYSPQPEQTETHDNGDGDGDGNENGNGNGNTPSQYPQYSYDIRLRYPQGEDMHSYPPPPTALQDLPPPPLPPMAGPEQEDGDYAAQSMRMDQTGQIAPVAAKPRVTATLWEDEGTLCFQVDVNGTCVARREDNHMVNGTKLLNVAGMTRGRRDGILKAEKQKHVVKIGPMHLKGVWIPFEKALEFANREKITEMLYPLFVHNISALLYHPANNVAYPSQPQAGIGSQDQLGRPVPAGQKYEYDNY
ncbi:uncharacterized protein RSE6_14772 [Rhynchosporium secalis]|uniref:HTH APSES-type domain-containing protein n=1 Tax=Rhynchosporium secalis TaxID=38038 RepID=A0A1E1MW50_RHYSE|nr:uncharacterized protein RSE6_14772 [Rhynchosporium secalis]